jgi:hypothetical protein
LEPLYAKWTPAATTAPPRLALARLTLSYRPAPAAAQRYFKRGTVEIPGPGWPLSAAFDPSGFPCSFSRLALKTSYEALSIFIFLGKIAPAASAYAKKPACAGFVLTARRNPPQPATGSNVLLALRWRLPNRYVQNDSGCGVSFRILFRDDLSSLRTDRHLLRWRFSYHLLLLDLMYLSRLI